MGLFSRREPVADNATTSTAPSSAPVVGNGHHHANGKQHGPVYSGALNKRPPFGQWLKVTWPDILTMALMGAIGLGVYQADPAPSRSFPVFFSDGEIVYPQFAYPMRNEIVPIWAAAMIASLVPIAVFFIVQIRIRSFWDMNNAVIGLLYSLIVAAVFQVFLKWLIGGLRPHFYAACKPNVPTSAAQTGNGLSSIMYDRSVCTGDASAINDALESFPSGHSTAAFAGLVFLSLYLNAKLKLAANYHPAMWKLIAIMAPLLGATLIAGALTIDEFHNWYDVVAGATIGSLMALASYRMVYAAVFDFRFNHVPLSRFVPFTYGAGGEAMQLFAGFHDAVWTRQVGWGAPEMFEAFGGAPGDASALSGAGGAGASTGYGNGLGGAAKTGHAVDRRPVGGHHKNHHHTAAAVAPPPESMV
ncbi:phosphatidate phosphatase [Phyllosticta citrichinensis]|uniref:Phosphatidate phosphatase n=1 Tax=Phyllosticta citrichinensis TaxID=1130410 RepID=A0ABR1Y6L0_9PEZI